VRRFLPEDASDEEVAVRTVWLARQPIFFVREADALSLPPFSIRLEPDAVERLVETLAALSLSGLTADRP
jgi:hypothetical protein